jgi:lysyl-tRNA synthetase class I
MDGLPVYLDQEKFKPFMGKPLCNVPSPDGVAKNYAEYFVHLSSRFYYRSGNVSLLDSAKSIWYFKSWISQLEIV